ncbi:MAG TPA: hypothetical protein VMI06_15045 [Terriglobia bacterium]|nr:hypothetical protein [Terriglobia bacterium]
MIRVYFVFEDPLDDAQVNLSFADVPTRDPGKALARVEEAAESGELWKAMCPDEQEHPYTLVRSKMSYLDISVLTDELSTDTVLPV